MLKYPVKNKYGIDIEISKIAVKMHQQLLTRIDTNDYDAYYRCFYNPTGDDSIKVEAYDYENDIYVDILTDISKDLSIFFTVADDASTGNGITFTKGCELYVIANLDNIYANEGRADQRIQSDVVQVLNNIATIAGMEITGIEEGETIFDGLAYIKKYNNMQPYHVFKVNLDISYELLKCI